MRMCRTLDLTSNRISGSIPQTVSNMTSLTAFVMKQNMLTGTLPDGFAAAVGLRYYQVYMGILVMTCAYLYGSITSNCNSASHVIVCQSSSCN